jgi:hypothetical protein
MPEPTSSTSSFRRFLFRILLPLVLVIGVAGLLFGYWFERAVIFSNPGCGAYKVSRIIHETHPGEIPIFGSSRAEGCMLPDSLGPRFFNYGLSGTRYDITLFFLEEECRKQKTTPWILLNLDLDGLLRAPGDIANYIPNCSYAPVRELLGTEYRPYFSIPFLRYYGRFETYVRAYMTGRIELTKVTNKGAAIEKNELPRAQFDALVAERRSTPTTFVTDTALKQKLFSLITTHPQRRFVFIVAPYHSSFFDKYQNPADLSAFMAALKALPNVSLLDYSRLPLADSQFLNTSHINFKGAVPFNHLLRDTLAVMGVK